MVKISLRRGFGGRAQRRRWLGVLASALACTAAPSAVLAQPGAGGQAQQWRQQALALEHGEGVARDPVQAVALYCRSARLGDAQAQYNLGWMYANGRGVARSDAVAAFFFYAAAQQGLEGAQRMLQVVGGRSSEVPDCMRAAPPVRAAAPPPCPAWTTSALRRARFWSWC